MEMELEMQLNDFWYDCSLHQITITLQITFALNWIHEHSFIQQPTNTRCQWKPPPLETHHILSMSHPFTAAFSSCTPVPPLLRMLTSSFTSCPRHSDSFIHYVQILNVRISIHQHDISICHILHTSSHRERERERIRTSAYTSNDKCAMAFAVISLQIKRTSLGYMDLRVNSSE